MHDSKSQTKYYFSLHFTPYTLCLATNFLLQLSTSVRSIGSKAPKSLKGTYPLRFLQPATVPIYSTVYAAA